MASEERHSGNDGSRSPDRGPSGSIVIIGAGYTGTMLAVQLVKQGARRLTLIERRPEFGRGLAYSAEGDQLLNVRASRMSAFPDDAGHFARWLGAQGLGEPSDFAPRKVYGSYLGTLLAEACAGGQLELVSGDAVDLRTDDAGFRVVLDGGSEIAADAVVLALGNMTPSNPWPFQRPELWHGHYLPDPWSFDAAAPSGEEETTLLIGTGLTMIDVALQLDDWGYRGKIIALSRRGLLPLPHADVPHAEGGGSLAGLPLSQMVRRVRRRSEEVGWRAAVDELRPFTHEIWRSASAEEQARFLRHLRPWWDVHRHRVAPALAERIERLRSEGRLELIAGKIEGAVATEGGIRLEARPRGTHQPRVIDAAKVVNCTGPSGDISRAGEQLLDSLLRAGVIQPDRHRLGIEIDEACRAVAADGSTLNGIYALGPIAKGGLWEVTAVPDLRSEAVKLARILVPRDPAPC